MDKVFVYDPTVSDKLSSVRGIGRYLQILKENFPEWTYVNNETMKQLNNDCVFINPFFNFLQPPVRSSHGWTLRKRLAKKQIAVIHDLIPLKYPSHFPAGIKGSIYILLNKLALKNYDLIITDSEASKKDIINILRLPERKIKVIYPCLPIVFTKERRWKLGLETGYEDRSKKLDKSIFHFQFPDLLPNLSSSFCLYVGDATWNKNLVNLARAIKIANISCVFVGKVFQTSAVEDPPAGGGKTAEVNNGWQKEFKEFINETKDDKRFVFAGFVPDSDLIKLYQQATLNILPSRDEGFGFSYLEASQFGCPSLLSDIPILREISAGNAIFFDPENPQDIANKIKQIYDDGKLRNKIGEEAKKRSEFFSVKKFREEFLSII